MLQPLHIQMVSMEEMMRMVIVSTIASIMILRDLLATPAEKSWIEEVSFTPVRRLSLSWYYERVKDGDCNFNVDIG